MASVLTQRGGSSSIVLTENMFSSSYVTEPVSAALFFSLACRTGPGNMCLCLNRPHLLRNFSARPNVPISSKTIVPLSKPSLLGKQIFRAHDFMQTPQTIGIIRPCLDKVSCKQMTKSRLVADGNKVKLTVSFRSALENQNSSASNE